MAGRKAIATNRRQLAVHIADKFDINASVVTTVLNYLVSVQAACMLLGMKRPLQILSADAAAMIKKKPRRKK